MRQGGNGRFPMSIKQLRTMVFFLLPLLLSFPRLRGEEPPLTLEQAVNLALAGNERSQAAGEAMAVARAQLAKARSYFFPSLTMSGTYTRRPFEVSRTIGETDIVIQSRDALSGNLALNMIIFDADTIPAYAQARLASQAEKYNAIETRRQLAFEVASAFLATLSADQLYEASRHRFEFARATTEAAKARYSAGLVSINDVTRTELEFATAERGMIQLQGQVQSAYLQLGYLIVAPVSGKLQVPELLLQAADASLPAAEAIIPEALQRRPDLFSLRLQAKALRAGVAAPRLAWLPSLNLTGQYRYTNEAGLTGKNTNWNIGLSLSWTILDGFYRFADFREKRALARQADLNAAANLRLGEVEVRGALVALANQQAALKQAVVALDVAKKNAQETSELYRQGLTGALQVADANVRLFESEVAMVNARYDLAIAFLNLRAAQGLDPFGKELKP